MEICQKSVNQIHGLTSKALQLVRLSGRDSSPALEPVQLAAAIDCCIDSLAPLFSRRGIRCVNQVAAALLVEAAPEQLVLLLDNLLDNSARYAAERGEVRVSAAQDGESVTVSVRDDGIGLAPDQKEQIFDEFFKADPARHDLNTQGLGLAICKRIVLNHKGRIWAQSDGAGKGTTISFTLAVPQKPHQYWLEKGSSE